MEGSEKYIVVLTGNSLNQKWGEAFGDFPHPCELKHEAQQLVTMLARQSVHARCMTMKNYEEHLAEEKQIKILIGELA